MKCHTGEKEFTYFAKLRCVKISPGLMSVITLLGTRESEHPIHKTFCLSSGYRYTKVGKKRFTFGDWWFALLRMKKYGSDSRMFEAHSLLVRHSWSIGSIGSRYEGRERSALCSIDITLGNSGNVAVKDKEYSPIHLQFI
jgi:hypothetical protein